MGDQRLHTKKDFLQTATVFPMSPLLNQQLFILVLVYQFGVMWSMYNNSQVQPRPNGAQENHFLVVMWHRLHLLINLMT